jgi:lysophospholipid acyltransferase (LPLAT)-like uncharacterized protein
MELLEHMPAGQALQVQIQLMEDGPASRVQIQRMEDGPASQARAHMQDGVVSLARLRSQLMVPIQLPSYHLSPSARSVDKMEIPLAQGRIWFKPPLPRQRAK